MAQVPVDITVKGIADPLISRYHAVPRSAVPTRDMLACRSEPRWFGQLATQTGEASHQGEPL